MKISSKSILSPARAIDSSQLTLSSSRRLKKSTSLKGISSLPMFPDVAKKRGHAFEYPEPSSPKVTCIGQVRVKTKKIGLKSKRRQGEIMMSLTSNNLRYQQECLPQRNQRWVHLPMTIWEALRAVGSEFNCFLPCPTTSCMSSSSGFDQKNDKSSCGAVTARWLVSLHEGDVEGREVEFLVRQEEKYEFDYSNSCISSRRRRRHVFYDIEINEDDRDNFGHEKEGDVSICVPPKNALLLMRCKSDPVKVEVLANRFCQFNVFKEDEESEEHKFVEVNTELVNAQIEHIEEQTVVYENYVSCEQVQENQQVEAYGEDKIEERIDIDEELEETALESLTEKTHLRDDGRCPASQEIEEQESYFTQQDKNASVKQEVFLQEEEDSEVREISLCSTFLASLLHSQPEEYEQIHEKTEVEVAPGEFSEPGPENEPESKLAMEVSKETWVCSKDFIQQLPTRHVTESGGSDGQDHLKNRLSIDSIQQLRQLPRSSCHYPSTVLVQFSPEPVGSIVSSKAYEPFLLARCKSEPMRNSTTFSKVERHGVEPGLV